MAGVKVAYRLSRAISSPTPIINFGKDFMKNLFIVFQPTLMLFSGLLFIVKHVGYVLFVVTKNFKQAAFFPRIAKLWPGLLSL